MYIASLSPWYISQRRHLNRKKLDAQNSQRMTNWPPAKLQATDCEVHTSRNTHFIVFPLRIIFAQNDKKKVVNKYYIDIDLCQHVTDNFNIDDNDILMTLDDSAHVTTADDVTPRRGRMFLG